MNFSSLKRVLCLLLVVVLVCPAMAASASSGRGSAYIVSASGNRTLEDNFALGVSGTEHEGSQLVEVRPDEELRIPITADLFEWSDGSIPDEPESVSRHDLKRARMRLATTLRSGSKALEYVQIETDSFPGKPFYKPGTTDKTSTTCYISVKFAEMLTAVEPVDFCYDIKLSINGRGYEELCYRLMGTYSNDVIKVSSTLESVSISDGSVLDTTHFIPKVKVDMGSGVTGVTSLNGNTKYYGVAYFTDSVQAIREEWPDVYPSIKMVYFLDTINLGRKGVCKVNLTPPVTVEDDVKYTVYYVYDEDMQYLGKSNEVLRYSDYYFISLEEIPTMELDTYEESLVNPPQVERDINL